MSSLSENTIKQIALGYLKSYYRLRPRAEGTLTITGTDMRGAGNIIADGFLRFIQEDNRLFSATFEATSYETRAEVLYRPRPSHVLWDGLAFASLLLPTLLAIVHIFGWFPLVKYDFYYGVLFLLVLIPFFLGLYFLIFRRLPRYRYIFAVEQFKQYQADDQWIAYGYDVFTDLPKKYRNQLIWQCTRYGFGLIEITAQRQPKLILAPSRAQNFVPRHQFLRLLTQGQWQNRLRGMVKSPWEQLKTVLKNRLLPFQNRYFRWFPRSYYNQWFLIFMGLTATFFLVRTEYLLLPIRFVNEKRYQKQLLEQGKHLRPETTYFLVDAPLAGFFDTAYSPYQMLVNEEQFQDLIQTVGSPDTADKIMPPVRIISAAPGEPLGLYYGCERFNNLDQAFFLVADSIYSRQTGAQSRLADLNDRGISATAVWPPCLGGTGQGFLVYLDELFFDSLTAQTMRDSLQIGLDTFDRPLRVMKFSPITN